MHVTAMEHGKLFFDTYVPKGRSVLDIGAQDVNGSLRSVAPPATEYTGVDFAEGKGVDVVVSDPYSLPFPDEAFDVVVSTSCFEHSGFFWLTFLEALRVLKPDGLLYVNAPSTGPVHRYPVDCWRFYPDAGRALQNWAKRNGIDAVLLESFTERRGIFRDFVAVFLKDAVFARSHPQRMVDRYRRSANRPAPVA